MNRSTRMASFMGRGIIGATLAVVACNALAHHSFAVFFDHEKQVSVKGKVSGFFFRNPHGIVVVDVTNPDGSTTTWKAETNSPSMMLRRGWTKDSVRVGDVVTVEGWPARDGAPYLRLRELKGPDGKPVGKATTAAAEMAAP